MTSFLGWNLKEEEKEKKKIYASQTRQESDGHVQKREAGKPGTQVCQERKGVFL